jgi:hypothetical protein
VIAVDAGGFLQVVISKAREHTVLVHAHCPSRFRYKPKSNRDLVATPTQVCILLPCKGQKCGPTSVSDAVALGSNPGPDRSLLLFPFALLATRCLAVKANPVIAFVYP